MKRIGMGIVGAGFVDRVDAVRRLGFVDVVAVAGSTEASAKAKADASGRAQRDAELPALSGQRRRDRQRRARLWLHRLRHEAVQRAPSRIATFEDGYRANGIVEAILDSAKQGSVWTKVGY